MFCLHHCNGGRDTDEKLHCNLFLLTIDYAVCISSQALPLHSTLPLLTVYCGLCISSQAQPLYWSLFLITKYSAVCVATNLCNVQYTSYKKKFVASVLASQYVRFRKNYPILKFPGHVSHNWQSVLCYAPLIHRHLISGYTDR
jgi:hypothetical protein